MGIAAFWQVRSALSASPCRSLQVQVTLKTKAAHIGSHSIPIVLAAISKEAISFALAYAG